MQKIILSIAFVLIFQGLAFTQSGSATLSGKLSFLKDGEDVVVSVLKYGYPFEQFFKKDDTIKVVNGRFVISFPVVTAQTCVSINFPQHWNNSYLLYYVGKGDSVHMEDVNAVTKFTGKGAKKYTIQYYVKKQMHSLQASSHPETNPDSISNALSYFQKLDSFYKKQLSYLKAHKSEVSVAEFNLLKADMIIANQNYKQGHVRNMLETEAYRSDIPHPEYKKMWQRDLNASWARLSNGINWKEQLAVTPAFYSFICSKYYLDSCAFKTDRPFNVADEWDYINSHFNGRVKDELLTLFLLRTRGATSPEYPDLVRKGYQIINPGDFKDFLQKIIEGGALKGNVVPGFSFPDTAGVIHHLSDFKGKLVVVDTWHWGCGPCRGMASALRKVERHYRDNKNVVFISMCCVSPKDKWLRGINEEMYSNKEVLNLYVAGDDSTTPEIPFLKSFFWAGDPNLLLIDKEGRWMDNPVRPGVDNGKDMIEKINKELERK